MVRIPKKSQPIHRSTEVEKNNPPSGHVRQENISQSTPQTTPQTKGTTPSTQAPLHEQPVLDRTLAQKAREFAENAKAENPAAKGQNSLLTRIALLSNQDTDDGAAKSEDAYSAMDAGSLYTRAPGHASVDAPELDAPTIDIEGRGAVATRHLSTDSGHQVLNASVMDGAISANMTTHTNDRSSALGIYLENNWAAINKDVSWVTHNGSRTMSGWVGGGFSDVQGGVTLTNTTSDGLTQSLGGFLGVEADRSVTQLGTYQGEDKSLQGKELVELSTSRGYFGGLAPGVLSNGLGLGARLMLSRSQQMTYRTHLSPDDAAGSLFDSKGVKRFVENKGKALNLIAEDIPLPDLSQPESLQKSDEVVVTVSGAMTGGLFVGGLGLGMGAHGTLRGDFELGVKKHDEHIVELVVTPTTIKGIQGSVAVPFLLDIDRYHVSVKDLKQGFLFDLRNPDARKAYLEALNGNLPGGLPDGKEIPPSNNEAADLHAVAKRETLPRGVARTVLETERIEKSGSGIDVGFGLLHRTTGFGAIGAHRKEIHRTSAETSLLGTFNASMRGIEKRRRVLLSGEESTGAYASMREKIVFDASGKPTPQFQSLALSLLLRDTKVRGNELNEEIISTLNEKLELHIPQAKAEGKKESRTVHIETNLNVEDFRQLQKTPMERCQAANERSSIDLKAILSFLRALQQTSDPRAQAGLVQEWIKDHGLNGFTALHALMGSQRDSLQVRSSNSRYDNALQKADELRLKYRSPISPEISRRALTARYKEVEKALLQTAEVMHDVQSDGMLSSSDRDELFESLGRARKTLEQCIAIKHLQPDTRDHLKAQLDRGWTTGLQYRIMDYLSA